MFVVFNARALLICFFSVLAGVVIARTIDGGRNEFDRGAIVACTLMFAIDFIWRLISSKSLNQVDHPDILRRKRCSNEARPQHRFSTLFHSDYGGQLFWIVPVWIIGVVVGFILIIQQ